MTRHSLLAAIVMSFAHATATHAHPGHGEPGDDFSLAHYVTQPVHLGAGLCLFVGAILLVGLIRASYFRRRRQESVC